MLGYVQVYKPDLKIREYEIYQGYYCGICKYIGSEYGQLPRMSLSYDAAFLALLLASVEDAPDSPAQEHCVVHHIKKKTIVRNRAIEYAGDVMLILAWYKLLDDAQDEGKRSAKALMLLLRKIHKKLFCKYPALCDGIEINLTKLQALEKEKCESIDRAAETFSKIMEVIFSEGAEILYENNPELTEAENLTGCDFHEDGDLSVCPLHEIYAKIGYHIGKWIYLMDAVDDIEENIESGAYNPLLYRFEYDKEAETTSEFRERIHDRLKFNLYHYLAIIGENVDSLDIKKNKGIIDNIIYFGLNRKTEEVLERENQLT